MLAEEFMTSEPSGSFSRIPMPPDAPCPDRSRLQLLLHGGDTQPDARAVRGHVDRCDVCQAVLRILSLEKPVSARTARVGSDTPRVTQRSSGDAPGPGDYPFL